MHFTKVLLAAAAFTLASAQQVEFTMGQTFFAATYTAGVSSMNLTWIQNSGPVTLKLKNGPKTALNTVALIASGVAGNSYPYTPPSSLANGQYAFEIDDSSSGLINYSAYFTLTGGSGTASNSTTSASTSGSSSSTTSSPTTSASTTKTTSPSTKTSSTSTSTPTSSSTTPNTNSASSISSPLALILLAFVAMVTLN